MFFGYYYLIIKDTLQFGLSLRSNKKKSSALAEFTSTGLRYEMLRISEH